ncbi:Uncharacterised protein [Candidatus Anstonella stagnisolia]|nr:Uncharacterised protein [Candidatus Anstonella stagnisolia]
MEEIEIAFGKVTKILLGKELRGIDAYAKWIAGRLRGGVKRKKSVVSGNAVLCPSVRYYEGMGNKVVTAQEALLLGEKKLEAGEVEALSLASAKETLSRISTSTPEIVWGTNIGTLECSNYGPTQYCYRSAFCWFSKCVAYSFWPRECEYAFGCSYVLQCSFCIHCYNSTKLSRCFEVSDSTNCADCYFCHNCENVNESMFCFNAKNLRYAIGNREVGREAYMRVKAKVLAQIADGLEKEKRCEYDIYKIGCGN